MSILHVEVHENVWTLELNRPERLNALNAELVEALHTSFDDLERAQARALVIWANGRSFSAGFDLRQDLSPDARNHQLSRMQDLTKRLRAMSVPSVCAVHGNVVGGGLELSLACDLIMATPDAQLSFPDVRAGFGVGGGATYLLTRMIGLARTRLILMTGGQLNGVDAHSAGLVALIASAKTLHTDALALGQQLAQLSPQALATIRLGIDNGLEGTLQDALDRELGDMLECFHSSVGESTLKNFRDHGTYSAPE